VQQQRRETQRSRQPDVERRPAAASPQLLLRWRALLLRGAVVFLQRKLLGQDPRVDGLQVRSGQDRLEPPVLGLPRDADDRLVAKHDAYVNASMHREERRHRSAEAHVHAQMAAATHRGW